MWRRRPFNMIGEPCPAPFPRMRREPHACARVDCTAATVWLEALVAQPITVHVRTTCGHNTAQRTATGHGCAKGIKPCLHSLGCAGYSMPLVPFPRECWEAHWEAHAGGLPSSRARHNREPRAPRNASDVNLKPCPVPNPYTWPRAQTVFFNPCSMQRKGSCGAATAREHKSHTNKMRGAAVATMEKYGYS